MKRSAAQWKAKHQDMRIDMANVRQGEMGTEVNQKAVHNVPSRRVLIMVRSETLTLAG
jgi:hypothetical protein